MRILFIINDLAYFRAHRERLALDAIRNGYTITVAAGHCTTAALENWNPAIDLIDLDLVKQRFSLTRDFWLVIALMRVIISIRPAIIHCFTIKPILYGGIATTLLWPITQKTQLVWTFAGLGKLFEKTKQHNLSWQRKLVTLALKLTSRITKAQATFENDDDRQTIVGLGVVPTERAQTIMGTGIDLNVFTNKGFPTPPDDDPVRFLLASRLINAKGVATFLNVAESCTKEGLTAEFVVAGIQDAENPDNFDMALIEAAVQSQYIKFIGNVPQADMPRVLATSDVVCLPTQLREGFPRSLLEAAACGTAMIASDQPSMRTIVIPEETGWLLSIPDEISLKVAVDDAISDPKKTRQMGSKARAILQSLPVTPDDVWRQFRVIYTR